MRNLWTIWKHALGSFDEEDGYDVKNEDYVGIIRTVILAINVVCALFIMANVINNWS
tara:strand:+ start:161 stop:331 length:171 start_codon:yes stop_codon:yes gene_type:complete